jgi:hypothetical protein
MSLLGDDSPEPPPFTDDLLPPAGAQLVREMAEEASVPPDYVAGSLLSFISAALGNARWASPLPSWAEPPHLWVAAIGAPSTGKTPSMRAVVNSAASLEADEDPAFEEAVRIHARDASRAKAAHDAWQDDIRAAVKNMAPAPDMPRDAMTPAPPVRPRLKVADSTVQELGAILAGNPKGLMLIRDELAGLLGSMDQFGGNGSDRAFYLEAWNGGSYTVDRRKFNGVPIRVPHVSLSILGGIQPDKLREALAGADDGLAARFIFMWPNPAPFRVLSKLSSQEEAASRARAARLTTAGRRLRGLRMALNEGGEPAPVMVGLDPTAFEILNGIRRDSDALAKSTRGLAGGWHGKTPARALRLALVFEFLAWALADDATPEPTAISARSMAHSGEFLEYAAAMLDRALAGLLVETADADAAMIGHLLVKERPHMVNERALYRRPGLHFLRTRDRRVAAFKVLESAGFVRPKVERGPGRPRGEWLVNPRLGAAR